VLVSAYGHRDKIVAIEQPEIHLHPGLQAELGDLFIESALGERKNTFILETHSEHLILRIMRRMRETAKGRLPEGMLPVRPEDVAIIYVEPAGKQLPSVARVIRLDQAGDLIDEWPGGFFEEGYRETFAAT
jgi:predicted ATPase